MSKIKRGSIAFLLSIITPGLGHIYNGQLFTGILLIITFVSFVSFASLLGLLYVFRKTVAYVVVLWVFQLAVAIRAAFVAARQVQSSSVPEPNRGRWALIFGGIVFAGLTTFGMVGVRSFKMSAESMSPTLIIGDHFAVDVRYYKTHRPNRGDVIVFRMPTNDVLVIKRVIAVEGDTIEGGPEGTTVNGQLLSEPYVRHTPTQTPDSNLKFGPADIPSNELFVMGDNRGESYDSRHYGFVGVPRVIGKALYVYYSSSDTGRIGHAIQ